MKRFAIALTLLLGLGLSAQAQRQACRTGTIFFSASSPLEKIDATNDKVSSVIDTKTGKLEYAVLINAFRFEKALMQEHFNENYMESGKYPKATFKGQIDNLKEINFAKPGKYKAQVSGNMTIHGVTQPVATDGEIQVLEGGSRVRASFKILIADYKIEIPSVVRDKIGREATIKVDCEYKPMG